MPTNRTEIIPLERQEISPQSRPTNLAQLNDLLSTPGRQTLILGPIRFPNGLGMSATAVLRVPVGYELVVLIDKRLREILPAGSYNKTSWLKQPETELYLVDTRERNLQIETRQEISLSYPRTATEDILFPHDLSFGLIYQVVVAERTVLEIEHPLLDLYDTALDLLLDRLNGVPIDQIYARLQHLPVELRERGITSGITSRLGIRVTSVRLIGRPLPTHAPGVDPPDDPVQSMLQAQLNDLKQRSFPIYGQMQKTDSGYSISVPLIDHERNQMLLRITCDQRYPHHPPQLAMWINNQPQAYRPALLATWQPSNTLADLIDAVIDDQS